MKKIFSFGENVHGYDVRVFNEREVRAAAGILFLFASISFFNALLINNFVPIKIFIIAFLIDFLIRIFINPKFSPSMIVGRFTVSNQKVEYSGAPQKRFAWGIGLFLSITMFFLVVMYNVTGPVNLLICLLCLTFLFLETSCGICVGCTLYNVFNKGKATLCPGGACEIKRKQEIQKISIWQIVTVLIFLGFLFYIALALK
jgi:hypothetical protein